MFLNMVTDFLTGKQQKEVHKEASCIHCWHFWKWWQTFISACAMLPILTDLPFRHHATIRSLFYNVSKYGDKFLNR
jgi:hypothetical protein